MNHQTPKIVSLPIELIQCGTKAMNASRIRIGGGVAGGYTVRGRAIDDLKKLPDDREDALVMIRAYSLVYQRVEDRRRVTRVFPAYYERLNRMKASQIRAKVFD